MNNNNGNKNKLSNLIIIFGTALLLAIVYAYTFDKKMDINGDNANYFMLGKALATGNDYVNINSINASPNNHFPPGYPFIISLVIRTIGDHFTTIKLVNGFFFLGSLIVIFFLFQKMTDSVSIPVVTLVLLIVNSHLLRYSTMIMTEIPFVFFSSLTLLCFLLVNHKEAFYKDKYFYFTVVLMAGCYYIKTSAITIVGGVVIYQLWLRAWKPALGYILGFSALISPWLVRGHLLGGNSYLKQLLMVNPYRPEMGMADPGDFVGRFFNNLGRYITKEIPSANFSFISINYREETTLAMWVSGLLITGLLVYGIIKLKNYRWLVVSYLIGTFGILFLWPDVWVGVRFLLPAVPFLMLAMINAYSFLVKKYFVNSYLYLKWLPLLLVLAFISPIVKAHRSAAERYMQNWGNYFAMAKWVRDNAPDTSVVACRKPTMFYLYSGSYTVNYKYTDNQDDLIKNLYEKKVDYVVYDQLGYSTTYRYLRPVLQNNQSLFELVKKIENPPTYLFKLLPIKEPDPK